MAQMTARNVRVTDEAWEQAKQSARARGENLSEVIRGLLADYASENLPGYAAGFAAGRAASRDVPTKM